MVFKCEHVFGPNLKTNNSSVTSRMHNIQSFTNERKRIIDGGRCRFRNVECLQPFCSQYFCTQRRGQNYIHIRVNDIHIPGTDYHLFPGDVEQQLRIRRHTVVRKCIGGRHHICEKING